MAIKPSRSIGIKELKDRASSIVEDVLQTQQPFTITRNNREVARIVPIDSPSSDPLQTLKDMGMIASLPKQSWKDFKLPGLGIDAKEVIEAIRAERDETG